MAKYFKIDIVIFMSFLIWNTGNSQNLHYEQYTDADGLPSMTIYEMIQDSNGILWMGTENGLVSYDGESFLTYTHPDLQDNDIIQIELNKDGDILFTNLSHQLSKLVNDSIQILFAGEGLNYYLFSTNENDFIVENSSNSLDATYKVYELKENQLHLYAEANTHLNESKRRNGFLTPNFPESKIYYLLENDSFLLLKDEIRQQYEEIDSSIFDKFQFDSKDYRSANQFFMATANNKSLALLYNLEAIYVEDSFKENYKTKDVQRLVIFEDKYFVILNNSLEVFDPSNGQKKVLLDNMVVNIAFKDRENNIWVSTRENGLLKFPNINLNFTSIPKYEQILTGVYATKEYVLLLWGDKIVIRNKENENVYEADFETNKKNKVKVHENSFHITTILHINMFKSPDEIINSQKINGPSKAIEYTKSKLYVSSKNMVVAYSFIDTLGYIKIGERIKKIDLKNSYALKYSKNQNLFLVGTTKGLYTIDKNDFVSPYVHELSSSNISDIVETADSSFWISTKNEGIYKIKDGEVIYHYTETNGLLTNNINDLDFQDEYIYAASTNGVIQINRNTNSVVVKNSNSGLPSDNITNLAIFNDSIWIAIQKDIVVVDSTFFTNENVSSTISLEKFYCNNKLIEYRKDMKFSYDKNKIDISFRNVTLSSGSNKSLKYRIPVLDTAWVYTKESVIRLPSLLPSKYKVEAIGVNAEGNESNPLHLFFEIKAAWWETFWARALGILLVAGIVSLVIRIRGQRIRKEESLKIDYLHQINKIKDQALQLQMNPHFIFNSLNAIQGFIGTDDEEMAMNYLARFARLIRLIFEHSKGNTITLEEELEFINLYLDLEKLRFKDKVNIEITIDPEVEKVKDIINVPPLLIQPIIENSFKHGLFHKKGKGKLSVKYILQNETLEVIIQDDGIGREESKKISQHNTEKHTSSGIKTTLERIDLLNFGLKNKKNNIKIEDLYDDDGCPTGTKTTLNFIITDD